MGENFYTKENNRYKLKKINTDIVLIEETNKINFKWKEIVIWEIYL